MKVVSCKNIEEDKTIPIVHSESNDKIVTHDYMCVGYRDKYGPAETKLQCRDCGKVYWKVDYKN